MFIASRSGPSIFGRWARVVRQGGLRHLVGAPRRRARASPPAIVRAMDPPSLDLFALRLDTARLAALASRDDDRRGYPREHPARIWRRAPSRIRLQDLRARRLSRPAPDRDRARQRDLGLSDGAAVDPERGRQRRGRFGRCPPRAVRGHQRHRYLNALHVRATPPAGPHLVFILDSGVGDAGGASGATS